jgi:DNA-binding NtrC family response regulator
MGGMSSISSTADGATDNRGRILLADDEPTFLHALADLLRREGYDVITAADAFAAAAALNTDQFDLLIADLQMPGNPDLELIRHVPQITEGMPVIIVTAYPSRDSRLASAELTVQAYMVKPVNFDELLRQVHRCVAHGAAYRASRSMCRRLEALLRECRAVEQLLARGVPDAAPGATPQALVHLTVRGMVGCLRDLHTMCQKAAADRDGSGPPGARADDSLGRVLTEALRVFEAASSAFRTG